MRLSHAHILPEICFCPSCPSMAILLFFVNTDPPSVTTVSEKMTTMTHHLLLSITRLGTQRTQTRCGIASCHYVPWKPNEYFLQLYSLTTAPILPLCFEASTVLVSRTLTGHFPKPVSLVALSPAFQVVCTAGDAVGPG